MRFENRNPGLGFSFWFIREAKFKNLWTPDLGTHSK